MNLHNMGCRGQNQAGISMLITPKVRPYMEITLETIK